MRPAHPRLTRDTAQEEARARVLEIAAAVKAEKEGGGSRAASEKATLVEQLGKLGKRVHEVPADGDCLYLAVAHQLTSRGEQLRLSSPSHGRSCSLCIGGASLETEVQLHACTLSLCIVVPCAYATEVAEPTARAIRGAVASRLRAKREDFEPFMELEGLKSGDGKGTYDACGVNRPF